MAQVGRRMDINSPLGTRAAYESTMLVVYHLCAFLLLVYLHRSLIALEPERRNSRSSTPYGVPLLRFSWSVGVYST